MFEESNGGVAQFVIRLPLVRGLVDEAVVPKSVNVAGRNVGLARMRTSDHKKPVDQSDLKKVSGVVSFLGVARPIVFKPCSFQGAAHGQGCFRRMRHIDVSKVAACHANTLVFGHYAAYFKRLAKSAKAIVQIHTSFNPELRSGRAGLVPMHAAWLYLYYRGVLRGVDWLAFVSETARRTFGRCHGGAPEGETRDARRQLLTGGWLPGLKLPRQTVVYNGIDTALFPRVGKSRMRAL